GNICPPFIDNRICAYHPRRRSPFPIRMAKNRNASYFALKQGLPLSPLSWSPNGETLFGRKNTTIDEVLPCLLSLFRNPFLEFTRRQFKPEFNSHSRNGYHVIIIDSAMFSPRP